MVSATNSISTGNITETASVIALMAAQRSVNGSGNARHRTALCRNSARSNEPMPRAKRRRVLRKEQHRLVEVGPDNGNEHLSVAVSLVQSEEDVSGHVGSEAFRMAIVTDNLKARLSQS